MSTVDARQAITQAHRREWARVVAILARRFGDLDIAEEAAAEAFATAVANASAAASSATSRSPNRLASAATTRAHSSW